MGALRIVVCAKEVPDPDAVNNYALAGRLVIGEDGRTLTQSAIPRLMNAYDEQAIEAALRLRDAGRECRIQVASVGSDTTPILRHAAALGADETLAIPVDSAKLDPHGVAALLAAGIRHVGGADLVLCGRQASDDDQGVVAPLIGEDLGVPTVTFARAIEAVDGEEGHTVRVTRVTAEGDEVVEVSCPVVVTVSNELGEPRYPTTARKIAARRMQPRVLSPDELSVPADALQPRVVLTEQFVPTVQGSCEFIEGDSAAERAVRLVARLREEKVLP